MKLVARFTPIFLLIGCLYSYLFYGRFLTLADAQVARRALLLSNATTEFKLWDVTLAFKILATIAHPWVHNLFLLRCFGLALVALGSLLFAISALRALRVVENKGLIFIVLFLGGLGLYTFQPGNMPEFNHLAVFLISLVAALLLEVSRKNYAHFVLINLWIGIVVGVFAGVNLSSAGLTFFVVSVFWFLVSENWDRKLSFLIAGAVAFATYFLLCRYYGGFTFSSPTPGLKYYETALSELEKFKLPSGNFLYMILRSITFFVEGIVILPVLALVFFLGKYFKKPSYLYVLYLFPFLWTGISIYFSYRGFDPHQVPGSWDFSGSFFLGKFFWYGYATAFPILIFLALILGTCQYNRLLKPERLLLAALLLIPLSACFGSGARVVHKLQIYLGILSFVFIFILQKQDKLRFNTQGIYLSILVLIASQAIAGQVVPFQRLGGAQTFHYSLEHLPRGKYLYAQKELGFWIDSLYKDMNQLGISQNEPVYSNDFLAVYLLGLKHVTLRTQEIQPAKFALLLEEDLPLEDSKLTHSRFLRLVGPPDKQAELKEIEDLLKTYIRENGFYPKSQVPRGTVARSVLYTSSSEGLQ